MERLELDRGALDRVVAACASSAVAGAIVGGVYAFARGRSARHLPEYAANTCANFTLFGTTYALALEMFGKASGTMETRERALAGALTGGGGAWAHLGRARAAAGAAAGGVVAVVASAAIEMSDDRRVGEGATTFEFPSWSPIQVRRADDVDAGDLFARMSAATRGELSAEDEARTRDEYLRWKMRRAERGR